LAVLFLSGISAGVAFARPPSIAREARRAGLDNEPVSSKSSKVGGVTSTRTDWQGPAGYRWEIQRLGRNGALREHVQGIQLENGRFLSVERNERRTRITSNWRANGNRFEHVIVLGRRAQSWRTSGNGLLRRVIDARAPDQPGAPRRYVGGLDIGDTLEAMPKLAQSTRHSIVVNIHGKDVVARVGEGYTTVRDRARALGAIRW
jgi:hypothetical protein